MRLREKNKKRKKRLANKLDVKSFCLMKFTPHMGLTTKFRTSQSRNYLQLYALFHFPIPFLKFPPYIYK